ncbi:TolC family protein [Ideonella livida]|uniref:TolC family protein n=1 Tax=Ideonella livida TaxID=2707176 RepID=A0A7C9PJK9_9BURK|nr:TolC family protein [Ideonella livida]NDY93635.1 TolC family protein [Ideonella livida]
MSPSLRPPHRPALAVALILSALLAGCATPGASAPAAWPPETRDAVAAPLRQAYGLILPDTAADTPPPETLTAPPLDMDRAVRLALHQHPGLQARLAELGVTLAERDALLGPPNPRLELGLSRSAGEQDTFLGLNLDLGKLLLRPWLRRLEGQRVAAAQEEAAEAVLQQVLQVRLAFIDAVAAAQAVNQARQSQQAAEAAALLAQRMADAGHVPALRTLRERTLAVEARLTTRQAQAAARLAEERLLLALGLAEPPAAWQAGAEAADLASPAGASWAARVLPAALPALPAQPLSATAPPAQPTAQRLDLQASRQRLGATTQEAGAHPVTPWLEELEMGLGATRPQHGAVERELHLSFPLPFTGTPRTAVAQARAERDRLAGLQQDRQAASEIRQARLREAAAWTHAKALQEELLPLTQQAADQQLLRYNGMLTGPFELLAEARAQTATAQAAVRALRDYWRARAQLEAVVWGPAGDTAAAEPDAATHEDAAAPASPAARH